jgi:hypothetical protein
MGPEEAKFSAWFERKKKEGMVDIKFTKSFDSTVTDRETICAEINAMNEAIDAGKCTPINWKEIEGI